MFKTSKLAIIALVAISFSCSKDVTFEENGSLNSTAKSGNSKSTNFDVDFKLKASFPIKGGGEGKSEISAYDKNTGKLFIVNVEDHEISILNISDLDNVVEESAISLPFGAPNSVAVSNGKLAVAVEAATKQDNGFILVYDTQSNSLWNSFEVGALPDMVTFSPNGRFIVSANEGEPNDLYTNDPIGTISIIDLEEGTLNTLDFQAFSPQQSVLEALGFRVFGPGATLAMDVEPEYVAISDNSNYAWVTLQENNGVAKVNLISKTIEAIYPLGFKDYSLPGNEIDASDKDGVTELKNWPVFGTFMPDAIDYVKIDGMDFVITANEGDSRDYSGFGEEERIKDVVLDPTAFPNASFLQKDENIGRLKITSTLGDTDGDGDYDALYSYGARSFTIWTGNGQMVYDSGNDIALKTINTPNFNGGDGRSDDKGAEPESIEILKVQGNKYILFVGLERNNQVLVYDISNPYSPIFLQILSRNGDEGPEGVLAISDKDSPNGKDLLIVSNEVSGTVSIYQNN